MGEKNGSRAIVLGGSMAGLLAARVLAEYYSTVLIVDRDTLADKPGYRRGVPHGRHAHGLVAKGQQILDRLFPGLTDELIEAGVRPGDFNGDIQWYFNGRRMKPATSGLLSVPATRPVLEYHVRQRVRGIPNVTFIEQHDITGIQTTADRSRVTGAKVQPSGEADGSEQILDADLVIDTTGRGSRLPSWLEELGYARPAEDRVKVGLAYTTRHYQLPADPFGEDLAIIPAATPAHPRGAFFYRLPGDGSQVELSLTGILGDYPPADPEGFLSYVKSLPVPDIYQHIRDAEPLDDPVMFRFPASVWRHYERLPQFPSGLLTMGDAVCSFNPVYAQGMTVAALETLVLQRHLAAGTEPVPGAFFKDVAAEIAAPWKLAAGSDLGYPGVEGRRTPATRLINSYVSKLQGAAEYDGRLSNAFIRVAGLMDSPQSLLRPSTVLRVLRNSRRRPAPVPEKAEEAVPIHS